MAEQVPKAVRTYGAENLGPGDVLVTNDPYPSGVHLNDVSLISPVHHRGRADRLRREPGAPRRRRRRRARVDRRVPGGLPGGRDRPAGQARRERRHREGRLPADPRPDPLQARDGRRLPGADRREHDRRAPRDRARRPPRTRDDRRDDGGAARLHRAADAGGARPAAARRLRGGGRRRQRRLHGRAGAPERARRDRGRRRALRHDRLGPAAARTRQLDLRDDVLGLRLRAQVPDRPRPAGQRRLLPARPRGRPAGHGHELHLAGAGRRRLGDARRV